MTSRSNHTQDLATLHDSQSPSGFGADKTIAVVHDCVYCYTLWNTRASTTCAGYPGKLGTFRHILSIKLKRAETGPPQKWSIEIDQRVAFCRITSTAMKLYGTV